MAVEGPAEAVRAPRLVAALGHLLHLYDAFVVLESIFDLFVFLFHPLLEVAEILLEFVQGLEVAVLQSKELLVFFLFAFNFVAEDFFESLHLIGKLEDEGSELLLPRAGQMM